MDLTKHLEKAAEAVKRRNYVFAVKVYGQLLAIQPDNGDARAGLRRALFKKAAAKPPSRLGAWLAGWPHLIVGSVCRLLGRSAAAARAYERYLALDPLNEGVILRLGEALEKVGYQSSALAVYQTYAEVEPRCLPAARGAGALLYEAGDLNSALGFYEQALKIDPRDQESLRARKNLAAEGALAATGLATATHSRELIADKEEQRRLERSGRLQLSPKEVEEQLGALEARLAENPDDRGVLVQVAGLREMERDLQGALDCLERATQLAPEDSDMARRTGDLRLRLQEEAVEAASRGGDPAAGERARKALENARVAEYGRRVRQHPTDLGLRYDLGSAMLAVGELDPAIAELQQAVKDPRKRTEALQLLGRAFRRKGLVDLALGQLEKALKSAPQSGALAKEILYDMATLCQEAGHGDRALEFFSRILEQDIGFLDVAQKVDEIKASQSS
jgi:tetratricopeptide (TPR) repeat protein